MTNLPALVSLYRKISDTAIAAGECAQAGDPDAQRILQPLASISSLMAGLIECEAGRPASTASDN